MAVTASITVQFGAEASADAILIAELDDRPGIEGGRNGGRTQFLPGDTAYYLVYKHLLQSTTHSCSAGTVAFQGAGSRQVTETVVFLKEQEAELRYPVSGGLTVEWLGRNLGALEATGGRGVRAASAGVAVALVTYTTQFEVWGLSSPAAINGRNSFEIAVLIEGE